MDEKNTEELENVLRSTHVEDFDSYRKDNARMPESDSFIRYMKDIFKKKKLTQQTIFLLADIPERYGYKLLSGEKRTKQRDVILRVCYAADMSLSETQRALKKYGMPALYAKSARDALLMILFNEHPGDIIEVNKILKEHGFDALRSSGRQE